MNIEPNDPLSPEEQALAERLRRLGGPDGPSAALDARILASARAAAAPPRPLRRRWLAWSAVPGGAVTAAGTAAAFVLAVGLVWQLRPGERRAPVREAAADDGFVPMEVIERQAQSPAQPASAAAAAPEAAAPTDSRALAPASQRAASKAAASRTGDTAAVPRVDAASSASSASAAAVESAPAPEQAIADSEVHAVTAEPAAAPPSTPDQTDAPQAPAYVDRSAATRRPTYTTSARARPELRSDANHPPRETASAASAQDAAGPAPAHDFGPIAEDAELAPVDWLQRIRDRRERGDIEGATESLRRFREAHPRIRLPADLRALAR